MTFISKRRTVETVTHSLVFDEIKHPGSGFAFNCDEHGVVDVAALSPHALRNYQDLAAGVSDFAKGYHPGEVVTYTNRYTEPAVIRCECNATVALYGFTNTCVRCERDYNMSGMQLAPRAQWGEETGESVSDILEIDSASDWDSMGW